MWNHVKITFNLTWTSLKKFTKDTIACTIQLVIIIYRNIACKINSKCNQPNTRYEGKCLQSIYRTHITQPCPIAEILVWGYIGDALARILSEQLARCFYRPIQQTVSKFYPFSTLMAVIRYYTPNCISNSRNSTLHTYHLMSVLETYASMQELANMAKPIH